MQKAVVDIGNTKTKIFLFNNSELLEQWSFDLEVKVDLSAYIAEEIPLIISAVGNLDNRLNFKKHEQCILLSHQTPLPILLNYDTPETLGLDRIANAVAVANNSSHQLIIDIGSCVTFDLLDRQNVYQGGLIYPGIDMRFKAMHKFTDKLPSIDWRENWTSNDVLGKSTQSSMLMGVKQSMIMELDGLIHRYNEQYHNLDVHLTGGDSVFFEKELKSSIFAQPYLGAVGLRKILEYNL